ncbi:hypothetical protein [Aeoliella sp. SH292]|uniref:hypothetical protein n=1 Tax=Aeoliella sp. SH292 TaxID=3454464 RepID=UPI003F9854B8
MFSESEQKTLAWIIEASPLLRRMPSDHPLFSMGITMAIASAAAHLTLEPHLTKPHLGRPFPYGGGIAWLPRDAPPAAVKSMVFLVSMKNVVDAFDKENPEEVQKAVFYCGMPVNEMSTVADTGHTTSEVIQYFNTAKAHNSKRSKAQIGPELAAEAESRVRELMEKGISQSGALTRVAATLLKEGRGPKVTPDAYRKAIERLHESRPLVSLLHFVHSKLHQDAAD